MKLSIFAIVAASASAKNSVRNRRQNDDRNVEKRYSQLIDQMQSYNAAFDERQYWTYGCHCLMLGKSPYQW